MKNDSNLVDNLLKIKKRIDEAKTKKANLEGKIDSLLDDLKAEFDCTSFDEALKKLDSLREELEKQEQTLNQEIAKLQNEFDWE